MTEEEKYYSINKETITDKIIENSRGLVYEYKFKEWLEFIKYKKDDPKVLKIISLAIQFGYAKEHTGLSESNIKSYISLTPTDRINLSIVINSYFDEDIDYELIEELERKEMEYLKTHSRKM